MYHIGMTDKNGKIEKDKYKPQQLVLFPVTVCHLYKWEYKQNLKPLALMVAERIKKKKLKEKGKWTKGMLTKRWLILQYHVFVPNLKLKF